MIVIFFNGPPYSGKDTAADYVKRKLGPGVCQSLSFATPPKRTMQEMFAIPDSDFKYMMTHKEEPFQKHIHGMTPRECLIWISEEVMKPKFGERVFGEIAAMRLRGYAAKIVVVSDSGFASEVGPVSEFVGAKNCIGVHLYREGRSFQGDSRGYVDFASFGIVNDVIKNDYDMELYEAQLDRFIKKWRLNEIFKPSLQDELEQ